MHDMEQNFGSWESLAPVEVVYSYVCITFVIYVCLSLYTLPTSIQN